MADSASMSADDDSEFEVTCAKCKGTRSEYKSEDDCYVDCSACNGSGFQPTQLGARILALVRHNARLSVTADFRL